MENSVSCWILIYLFIGIALFVMFSVAYVKKVRKLKSQHLPYYWEPYKLFLLVLPVIVFVWLPLVILMVLRCINGIRKEIQKRKRERK